MVLSIIRAVGGPTSKIFKLTPKSEGKCLTLLELDLVDVTNGFINGSEHQNTISSVT